MTAKVLVRLSENAIESLCAEMREDPVDGFVNMWRTIEPAWDELDTVIPGAYAIEADASTRFINAMTEGSVGMAQEGQTNKNWVLLLWLNKGPSTVTPNE